MAANGRRALDSHPNVAEVNSVSYVNFRRFADRYRGELQTVMTSVVDSGIYIGGDEVASFERAFARFCGTEHAVGVASGQDALELTLRAWGIGPGDDVIVPANTAMPTALAVDHAGANIILVDVEDDTGTIDVAAVRAVATPATRAIVPVHLYGHVADMDALLDLARSRGVHVLEDASHAHGAYHRDRRSGALGDAAAFSCYPTKNLGALGDAGCVTTNDGELATRLRTLRNCGLTVKYDHVVAGFNSRLDPLQAAILHWKLARLDEWNARRAVLAARYFEALGDLPQLTLPVVRSWATPVWHAFAVRVRTGSRDDLERALSAAGIQTNVHYRAPIHLQSCYAGRWQPGRFPVSEARASELLSLPLDPFHTDEEIDRTIAAVRAYFTRPGSSIEVEGVHVVDDVVATEPRLVQRDARVEGAVAADRRPEVEPLSASPRVADRRSEHGIE